MTAPPARNTLSGTPTNAQFNAGIGALYDYTVGLLGAAGTPAAAREALGAVGLTGDQTIGGVKTFTGNLGIGTTSPGARLSVLTDSFYAASFNTTNATSSTTGISIGGLNTAAPGLGGSVVIRAHHNHSGTAASSMSFMTHDNSGLGERMRIDSSGNVTATGNITAGGQFLGNGAGLTNLNASNISGDVAAARITNALNASGSAPIYACRAWVNFDGTGTVAIRASGNVSSITDNGVGDYTVNFTTAMPDANYSVLGAGGYSVHADTNIPSFGKHRSTALTTSAARVQFGWGAASSATPADVTDAYVAIFR